MFNEFFEERIVGILRKTEKYTKTDMVYLAKGGFWSLLGQVVGSASSFVVVVLLANILPKELFGQYRFVLSIISIFLIFTLPGLDASLVRSVARKHSVNLPKVVKTKISWGLLGSFASLVVAGYYFYHSNTELTYALVLCAFFLPFIEAYSVYYSYYRGKQDFKTSTIYDAISRIFQAILIVSVALFTKNVLALLSAYFIGQIIARFFFYKKTLRDEKLQVATEGLNEKESDNTIEYGKHLSTTSIVGTITSNMDKLLVWHFLGAEILAIYYIALTIPRNVILLCNVIPRIALPKFSINTWEPHERIKIMRKLFIFLGVLIIPALIYSLLVPFVIPIIFKQYTASISVAVMLAFLIPLSPTNALIDQMLQARGAIKKIIFLQILAFIVFSTAFLILNQSLGTSVMTATIALIASEVGALLAGILFILS